MLLRHTRFLWEQEWTLNQESARREHGAPPGAPSSLPPHSILLPGVPERAEAGPEMEEGTEGSGDEKHLAGVGWALITRKQGGEGRSAGRFLLIHLSTQLQDSATFLTNPLTPSLLRFLM